MSSAITDSWHLLCSAVLPGQLSHQHPKKPASSWMLQLWGLGLVGVMAGLLVAAGPEAAAAVEDETLQDKCETGSVWPSTIK